jgi:phenylacetic acid degradation operon negative regulatory protein
VEPTPKSLILDLLSTLGRGSAPVRALVTSGRLFGIAENSLRVALTRLLAEGLIERDARGQYRLGPRTAGVTRHIRSWRDIEQRLGSWGGAWVAVHSRRLGGATPRQRRQRVRALRLLGFRSLEAGLELRPDNLEGGVDAVRDRLAALGLDASAPVFGLTQLDARNEARARGLWDAAALVDGYRETRARLETSAARLPDLPRDAAMAESFQLGGAAIRQLVLDPLLPEPIVPRAERRQLLEALRRYDRLGRRIWAGWLGADADDPVQCPAGVRGAGPAADVFESVGGV